MKAPARKRRGELRQTSGRGRAEDAGEAATVIRGLTPDLEEPDVIRLRNFVVHLLHRHEPIARRAGAAAIADAYRTLTAEGRRRFLQLLARGFWTDRQRIDEYALAMRSASDDGVRRDAEHRLRLALTPPAADVLRFLSLGRRGLMLLFDLRSDLLQLIDDDPALAALDQELQTQLLTFFDIGMLTVERISWDSPASLLERLIQHEAVHAIGSWPDLKSRLSLGRRCYALFHLSMPDEPLVFLELALTSGVVKSLPELLNTAEPDVTEECADTAVFYSISTCHAGLVGMNLASLLIKRVIEMLTTEQPGLRQFVTLSPIRGFRRWAEEELGVDELTERVRNLLLPTRERVSKPISRLAVKNDEASRAELLALCARYITTCKEGRALDRVANFHLANGASIGSLNWRADPSRGGVERSLGIMATYVYEVDQVAERAEAYITRGVVAVTQQVRQLVGRTPLRSRMPLGRSASRRTGGGEV